MAAILLTQTLQGSSDEDAINRAILLAKLLSNQIEAMAPPYFDPGPR